MSGRNSFDHSFVGLVAGWLAGQIVQGTGFGLVADIAIGIVGALIGSWLLPALGIHLGAGIVPPSSAPPGGAPLLPVLRLAYRRGRWSCGLIAKRRAVGFGRRPCLQAGERQPGASSEGAVVRLVYRSTCIIDGAEAGAGTFAGTVPITIPLGAHVG